MGNTHTKNDIDTNDLNQMRHNNSTQKNPNNTTNKNSNNTTFKKDNDTKQKNQNITTFMNSNNTTLKKDNDTNCTNPNNKAHENSTNTTFEKSNDTNHLNPNNNTKLNQNNNSNINQSDKKQMKSKDSLIFNYKWGTVIQGFWNKYPHPKLEFVKFTKCVDMEIGDDNKIVLKRVMFSQQRFLWGYFMEEIHIDPLNQVMEMQTNLIKQSSLIKYLKLDGFEVVRYSAFADNQTQYQKMASGSGLFQKFIKDFKNSFKTGFDIVDERCKMIQQMKIQQI